MPIFDTWKIRFTDRLLFNEAQRAVCTADVGHADMILTFVRAEDMEVAKTNLLCRGITQFSTETP